MFNQSEVAILVEEFLTSLNEISFEKSSLSQNLSSTSTLSSTSLVVPSVVNNNNYVDNSWNTYSTHTVNSNTSNCKDNEKEEDKKKEGNRPIMFLLGASALAFGATYLIATDDYMITSTKFKNLDDKLNKLVDKTKNTSMETQVKNIVENYNTFKNKLFLKYSTNFYSKLGLIGSTLVSLTYFFPFGTIALIPGILGLTGFGCYWLWKSLTKEDYNKIFDSFNSCIWSVTELKNNLTNNVNIKQSTNIHQAQPINYNLNYPIGVNPELDNPSAPQIYPSVINN